MLVSIIIPCFQEERRLGPALEGLLSFLDEQSYQAEVLVVENGSRDRTLEVARDFAARDPRVRVLSEPQRGKGLAVRRGMLDAKGEWRILCDVDFSMPVEEINRLLPPAAPLGEVLIASREAPGAHRVDEPFHRHLMGRVFNFLIRLLVLSGFHDTQCGFKAFRCDAARAIFTRQSVDGLSFDVEVLVIAQTLGYRVREMPITWYFDADSRVRPLRDTLRMVRDLMRIRWRLARGIYAAEPDQCVET